MLGFGVFPLMVSQQEIVGFRRRRRNRGKQLMSCICCSLKRRISSLVYRLLNLGTLFKGVEMNCSLGRDVFPGHPRGSPGDALLFVRQLGSVGMGPSCSAFLEGAALVLDSAAELSCCKTSALLSFQFKHQVLHPSPRCFWPQVLRCFSEAQSGWGGLARCWEARCGSPAI